MHAGSLLGSVSSIEAHGRHLIGKNVLTGDIEPRLHQILATLTDIAELLDSSRLQRLENHSERVAKTVQRILIGLYENGSVRNSDVCPETVDTAKRSAGISCIDGWLVVPLSSDPPGNKNWLPVFDVLQTRLDRIIDDFEQLASRLQPLSEQHAGAQLCQTVLGMLNVLETTIARIVAEQGYVTHRTDHGQETLLETVGEQMTAFTGDTDA